MSENLDAPPEIKPKGRGCWKRGCLISVLAALALIAWSFWTIGEPNRHAKQTLASLQPGMNVLEIEAKIVGRHYLSYQVQREKDWEVITREEFQKLLATPGNPPVQLRLMLTFLGLAPGRVSVFIEVGPDGRVQKVNKPYNWD